LALAWALALLGFAGTGCEVRHLHRFFASQPPHNRPFLFAHRGGGGTQPEATLPTFLATQANDPAAVIEFDVRRSQDGVLVVIHDDTVDRTTNGQGRVDHLTLAELQALDAGFCTTPGEGDGTAPVGQCKPSKTTTAPAALPVPSPSSSNFPFRGHGQRGA
jgi:glycerophosphoryl diester phosphodiesterase